MALEYSDYLAESDDEDDRALQALWKSLEEAGHGVRLTFSGDGSIAASPLRQQSASEPATALVTHRGSVTRGLVELVVRCCSRHGGQRGCWVVCRCWAVGCCCIIEGRCRDRGGFRIGRRHDTSAFRRLPGESSWQQHYRLNGTSRAWQTLSDDEESGSGDEPDGSLVQLVCSHLVHRLMVLRRVLPVVMQRRFRRRRREQRLERR